MEVCALAFDNGKADAHSELRKLAGGGPGKETEYLTTELMPLASCLTKRATFCLKRPGWFLTH